MDKHDPWIIYSRPNPHAAFRLIGIPHAGAGPSAFRAWFDSVDSSIELALIHLPGRERRIATAPIADLRYLVNEIADAVMPELSKPYGIFGHCFGALVAFELARCLRRGSVSQPVSLIVSNSAAPHLHAIASDANDLSDEQLVAHMRRLGDTPTELLENQEWLEIVLPTLRADLLAVRTYDYESDLPLQCSVHALIQEDAHNLSVEEVDQWSHQTDGAFHLHRLPSSLSVLTSQGGRFVGKQLLNDCSEMKM